MHNLCYLSTNRLHRTRASLIQTLKTLDGMRSAGLDCTLWMPPWHGGRQLKTRRENEMGVTPLRILSKSLLHSRWPRILFALAHRRSLRHFDIVYLRSVRLSLALSEQYIPHHLEIHTLRHARENNALSTIVKHQRQGTILTLIPISRSAADSLISEGADPSRILVAPSGVSLDSFADVTPYEGHSTPLRALYLGSISLDRGSATLAEIARRPDIAVTLIGPATTDSPPPNCRYAPPLPHDQVAAAYAQSDIVLMPYKHSLPHADCISPMKLFEAMAAARPIVVSDLPPIREIVTHMRNAFLVDPDDVSAWHRAIDRIQSDPPLARRMALQAREDARQYSWKNRSANVARMIQSVRPGARR